jgi:hypothetical protein
VTRTRPIVGRAVAADAQALSDELASVMSGRRPAFWSDVEVRLFLAEQHREVTIEQCWILCRDRFGAERTPSKSTIQRFWGVLDRVRSNKKPQ